MAIDVEVPELYFGAEVVHFETVALTQSAYDLPRRHVRQAAEGSVAIRTLRLASGAPAVDGIVRDEGGASV